MLSSLNHDAYQMLLLESVGLDKKNRLKYIDIF
ncbi:hypothetical protein A1122_13330 [Yersinia pestis A1122]|nr:hypothetical protein YPC_1557 [Yersinia pestis biovar Medievalis str. Harbin 35]AEL73295.1 hypothetical protein A1122_13330 [Yersinia pestis A1122]EEO76205.1 hypothetical protein YP516_2402 [Yersinia pestis Nepal516]EEO80279.1 hypothetical protein YPF_3095 [Yersinia pestis biovar Orientalis str. India 195]EEO84513.1 hypothetical protein YPH_0326 [Yersinia pestis biovar Orientalis str. PEXU2]EEO89810.1 hypothetical protein YPS_3084 [Yersinia pestis Pestoides A]EKS45388.1 hypothetical protei